MEILAQAVTAFFYGVTGAFAFSIGMTIYQIIRSTAPVKK